MKSFELYSYEYRVEMYVDFTDEMGTSKTWVCAFHPGTCVNYDPVYNKFDAEDLLNTIKHIYAEYRKDVPFPEVYPEWFRIVRRPVGQWEVI